MALHPDFSQFADRRDAGRQLAAALRRFRDDNPIILALPRGGVPVAREVAEALHAPLDVLIVRKIGAPNHPELGLGAVVDGSEPQTVLNDEIISELHIPPDYLEAECRRQLDEIGRRRALYRPGRPAVPLDGRLVIVVDDGIATGGTVRAVLRALSKTAAARIVLAVPVAPSDVLSELEPLADEIVCLARPTPFYAVGVHYRDFAQTTDAEVVTLLTAAARHHGLTSAGHQQSAPLESKTPL